MPPCGTDAFRVIPRAFSLVAGIISEKLHLAIGRHKFHLAPCADRQLSGSVEKGLCEPRFRPTPCVSLLWRTPVQPASQSARLPPDSPSRLPSLALAKLISLARMIDRIAYWMKYSVPPPGPYLDYPKISTPLLPQSGKSPGRVVEVDFSVLEPLVAEDWLSMGVRLRDSLDAPCLES